jgi:hypothetical protein
MKEWNKPQMMVLDAEFTAAGGNGGNCDDAQYDIIIPGLGKVTLNGTSGPALPLEPHI